MRSSVLGASRALGLLGAFLVVSLVSGALLAGLFLPAVGATGSLTRASVDYFNSLPDEFDEPPLSEQSVLLAKDGKTVLARFYQENRSVVPLSKIAPVMRKAIIAIEDSRFYQHGGVDPKGLLRALVTNTVNDDSRIQGASTLTQQYIKNVILETAVARGDRAAAEAAVAKDKGRKIKEIKLAIQLEKQKSKDQILEGYLNIANFGDATYGVEAASQYFFSSTASKLTLVQAATLAGLVQEPGYYNPFKKPRVAKARRDTVLTRMRDVGMITQKQYTAAVRSKLVLKKKAPSSGCITARDNMAYFCSYVRRMIEIDPRFSKLGRSEAERKNSITRGGLTIVSTIDPKLQKAAYKAVTKRVPVGDKSKVASAAVTVEPGTGKVLAMAQNKIYSPRENVLGQTEINFAVDKEYGGSNGFQTGSTFKGFTLAAWLKAGNSLGDVIDGSRRAWPFKAFKSCTRMGNEVYHPNNAENGEDGPVTVLEATRKSINTAYVAIQRELDLCDVSKTAMDLGAHLAAPLDFQVLGCSDTSKMSTDIPNCLPSMTLGPFDMSPLTMASGYATFAAEGMYCPPSPIVSIRDRNNKPVPFTATQCKRALNDDVAHGVTYALKTVLGPGGTARGLGLKWPAAGKTGTADRSVDTWFAGYTKQRATAVWVGDPTVYSGGRRSLNGSKIGGKRYGNIYGATIAAPIWRDVMRTAMKGLPREDWPRPPYDMTRGSGIGLPDVRGRSLGEAIGILASRGFRVSVGEPRNSSAPPGFVADTSPGPGSLVSPGSSVIVHPSTGLGAAAGQVQPAGQGDRRGRGNDDRRDRRGNGRGPGVGNPA